MVGGLVGDCCPGSKWAVETKPSLHDVANGVGAVLSNYSLQYGGSLELRFRGIIYILTSALSMSLYNSTISSRTRTIAVLAFGVLLVGGLIFG